MNVIWAFHSGSKRRRRLYTVVCREVFSENAWFFGNNALLRPYGAIDIGLACAKWVQTLTRDFLFWCGCGKGGVGRTSGFDRLYPRATAIIRPPAVGVIKLRHQTNISQAGRRANSKGGLLEASKQSLKGGQTGGNEMAHPLRSGRFLTTGHMGDHGQIANWMQINSDGMCKGLGFGPLDWIAWQQTQCAGLIQIFKDREGLGEPLPVDV
jgi:hypothetical protein